MVWPWMLPTTIFHGVSTVNPNHGAHPNSATNNANKLNGGSCYNFKHKARAVNVMAMNYSFSLMKSNKGKEKQGDEIDVLMVNIEGIDVLTISTEGVKKVCLAPLLLHKFEVQAD